MVLIIDWKLTSYYDQRNVWDTLNPAHQNKIQPKKKAHNSWNIRIFFTFTVLLDIRPYPALYQYIKQWDAGETWDWHGESLPTTGAKESLFQALFGTVWIARLRSDLDGLERAACWQKMRIADGRSLKIANIGLKADGFSDWCVLRNKLNILYFSAFVAYNFASWRSVFCRLQFRGSHIHSKICRCCCVRWWRCV